MTMQTMKLIAGETLLLEEEKGFCLVVDGLVQIFVKSSRDTQGSDRDATGNGGILYDDDEDEDHLDDGNQRYQLLTEVKNGASMSSLFSILSLFTEDVKLRFDDESDSSSASFAFPSSYTPDSVSANPFGSPASPRKTCVADGDESHHARESSSREA